MRPGEGSASMATPMPRAGRSGCKRRWSPIAPAAVRGQRPGRPDAEEEVPRGLAEVVAERGEQESDPDHHQAPHVRAPPADGMAEHADVHQQHEGDDGELAAVPDIREWLDAPPLRRDFWQHPEHQPQANHDRRHHQRGRRTVRPPIRVPGGIEVRGHLRRQLAVKQGRHRQAGEHQPERNPLRQSPAHFAFLSGLNSSAIIRARSSNTEVFSEYTTC